MADKTTHAQRRRAQVYEAARRAIRIGQILRELDDINDELKTCEPSKVPALKARADIKLRLLAKKLPDEKHIQHSGTVNHVNYDAVVLGLNSGTLESRDAPEAQPATH